MDSDRENDLIQDGLDRLAERKAAEEAAEQQKPDNVIKMPEIEPEPGVTPDPQNQGHVCPYCDAPNLRVYLRTFQLGPFPFVVIACTECRKPIPACLAPMTQMRAPRIPPIPS